jgi:hypothetical protein
MVARRDHRGDGRRGVGLRDRLDLHLAQPLIAGDSVDYRPGSARPVDDEVDNPLGLTSAFGIRGRKFFHG